MWRRAWGGLVFLALLGCDAPATGDLAQQYTKRAREVGIIPVYPPREEFQVGDVYFWSAETDNPDSSVRLWVSSFDWLRKRADDFISTRVVFRASESAVEKQTKDLYGTTTQTRADQRVETLPISAFPSVTANAGSSGSLGIFEALRVIGLAGGGRTDVELNFHDVRSYWVPNVLVGNDVKSALGRYLEGNPSELEVALPELRNIGKRASPVVADPCGEGRSLGMTVVTRVYLTRKIEFTYSNARIVAAGISRAGSTGDGTPPNINAVTVNNLPNTSGDTPTVGNDLITGLNTVIKANTNPGESFSFQRWDARGLTFEQTFVRPVAIGWEGFDFTNGVREYFCQIGG